MEVPDVYLSIKRCLAVFNGLTTFTYSSNGSNVIICNKLKDNEGQKPNLNQETTCRAVESGHFMVRT